MTGQAGLDFELELEFPDNPFNAARVFLGAMAYPERGVGQPGWLRVPFTATLWNYLIWNGRPTQGLRYLSDELGDPKLKPPVRRGFEGTLERGQLNGYRPTLSNSMIACSIFLFKAAKQLSARGFRKKTRWIF